MAQPQRLFPSTSRTLIQQIQDGPTVVRELSLSRFCSIYYPAIYGLARARGHSIEDAQDLTQEFFMEVVRDGLLSKFKTKRGTKLSSWLMKCFRNMEINHRVKATAQKRGGEQEFVAMDTEFAEKCHGIAQDAHLKAESAQDCILALSIWHEAEKQLRAHYEGGPNEALVNEIVPYVLLGRWPEAPEPSQREVALKHGTTSVRLRAFFTRTLKTHAKRFFTEVAKEASAGIGETEIEDLWQLLGQHYVL